MKILFLSMLLILTVSCSKNEESISRADAAFTANAIVLSRGGDCGNSYLIKLNDNISGIPLNFTNNVFYEVNLPNQFKMANLPVNVTFRLPANSEKMVCTTMGLYYPEIFIETASIQ